MSEEDKLALTIAEFEAMVIRAAVDDFAAPQSGVQVVPRWVVDLIAEEVEPDKPLDPSRRID